MSTEKAEALVLRVIEFSESSSVVTLYTREFGKISGLAKGARRPKGPFESALDLLSRVRLVFLRKSSDALDLLTEAKLERRFRSHATDLSYLYGAYYVAELLNDLTHEGDPHPELFDLAVETLDDLSTGTHSAGIIVLRFELSALRMLGHLPSLRECAECGNVVASARRTAFGLASGGVLCEACRPGKKQVVSLSNEAIDLLETFAEEGESWRSREIVRRNAGEMRGAVSQYIVYLLGHKPKMHEYLGVPDAQPIAK
ncbi:MAG: DNA repair protein RecO [Planctomycetia bacterium]|nr:DNA repair protein RecO [Planctomycetia bacterium]